MIILSFFLDGLISNYLNNLIPLFTLTSIVISSYYKKEDNLIKESIIIGILYDITYTNTVILNSLIFFTLSLLVISLNKRFNKNLPNLLFINTLVIIIYMSITYLLLILYQYLNLNFTYFLMSILNSIIINTIYIVILYIILRYKKVKFA